MSLNDRKIVSIILEQCSELEERCEGYRDEMIAVLSDVIEYERRHRVEATNIQKKINDKCNATARFLAEKRSQVIGPEE